MDTYSICVLGDRNVGKTSLVKLLTQDKISNDSAINIFTSLYYSSPIEWWDFSGNPKYNSLHNLFFKYFNGYILVFDITNKKSFKNLTHWKNKIEPWVSETESPIQIIGTKEDIGPAKPYPIEYSKASYKSYSQDDLDKFLSRVIGTDNNLIKTLNQNIEEGKTQSKGSILNKIKGFWKPLELP
jgi:small GTP-binding protein